MGCVAGHDDLSRERGLRREGVSPSIRADRRVFSEAGDEYTAWARDLAQVLADAALEPMSRAGPIGSVAHRLRSLCEDADGVPLAVVEARGGTTLLEPARPAVILCSPAMYGSRLLFRGYGAEQPALDAAMAGTDSLVLVEGAGAEKRLSRLVAALGECFPNALSPLPGSRQAATVVGVADDAQAGGAPDGVVRVPEVLAGLLWEWVKTTTPPEGEAPVEPYVSGIGGGGLGVPVAEKGPALKSGSERARPRSPVALDRLESFGRSSAVRARRVAGWLGLPPALCETVALAAELKDVGMADARFQRAFVDRHSGTGTRDDPAGWPRGGRHEALSARLVGAWLAERPEWGEPVRRDLLVHLVASHRGAARPLVVPVRDGKAGTVCARIAGFHVRVSADLAKTDWEQPARFRRLNRHFGPWGLALLESIVACSDRPAEEE
ncbi:MAG: hypothetical protein F4Y86_13640 [Gammaproteobacteria bacterium]|nr:hypothetical protein [Gammaproteobacteria bacterium]MYB38739.1 hypothetical protein [Gammaproteobacteria bacterium]